MVPHNGLAEIRTAACTFLNNILQRGDQSPSLVFEVIFSIIKMDTLNINIKDIFEKAYITAVQNASLAEVNHLIPLLTNALTVQPHQLANYLLLDWTCQCQCSSKVLSQLVNAMPESLKANNPTCTPVESLGFILKGWTTAITQLVANSDPQVAHHIEQGYLFQWLEIIYTLECPSEVYLSVEQVQKQLNEIKANAAGLHYLLLKDSLEAQQTDSAAFKSLARCIERISTTLVAIATNRQCIFQLQCQQFTVAFISLYKVYFKTHHLQFVTEYEKVLTYIVFPLLIMNEEEQYFFKEQPSEFDDLLVDCCQNQLQGRIKTEAAQLLEIICDSNRLFMRYALQASLRALTINLGFIPTPSQTTIEGVSAENMPTETAFLVLSILSYDFDRAEPQYLNRLKAIFCDARLKNLPPLETARLFQALGYICDQIFKTDFQQAFLVEYALEYNAHPTGKYCALDFVSCYLKDASTYHEPLFMKLCSKLLQSEANPVLWRSLKEIIKNFCSQISQDAGFHLVNCILQRIGSQYSKVQNGIIDDTQGATEGLNLLQSIISNRDLCKNKRAMVAQIWSVHSFWTIAKRHNMDDQLIELFGEIIQTCSGWYPECIDTIIDSLVRITHEEAKSFEGIGSGLIIALNCCVCSQAIHKLPLLLETIQSLIKAYFSTDKPKSEIRKIILSNVLLMLQNVIVRIDPTNSQPLLANVMQIVDELYTLFNVKDLRGGDRILFFRVTILAMQILRRRQMSLQSIIQSIYEYAQKSNIRGYDCKALTACLVETIFDQKNLPVLRLLFEATIMTVCSYETAKRNKGLNKNYDKIVKKIELPYSQKSPKEELQRLISAFRNTNQTLYSQLLDTINKQLRNKLNQLYAKKENINGTQRVILQVKGVSNSHPQSKDEEDDDDNAMDDQKAFKKADKREVKRDHQH